MSVNKPRTIDNLGIETSVRYARDMEMLDAQLVRDSQFIPSKTETSVLKPYAPPEFDQLFQVGKATLWASFNAPPGSSGQNLFTFQLIPSLGGYEKTEDDTERLAKLEDALKKPFSDQREEQEKEEKERKILINLLHCIDRLDKTLIFINARRNQYQRG